MNAHSAQDSAKLRDLAKLIFQAGIAAADPYQAVQRYLKAEQKRLQIVLNEQGDTRTGNWSKIHLIAFGKAACPMMKAAIDTIPAHLIGKTIAVTNHENVRPIAGVSVIGAGHPLPDAAGYQAAKQVAEIAINAKEEELVLVLVSGGGSALLPYPVDSVSLQEKIQTTNLLLTSGATINEMNCVRKHLSQLKGGGLAKLAAPADVHAMILSDVIGDDLSSIASGPAVPDISTFNDAVEILKTKYIWDKLPDSVRRYLEKGRHGEIPETPKPMANIFANVNHSLVGSNRISVSAITKAAEEQGFHVILYSDNLNGEARKAAEKLVAFAKQQPQRLPYKTLAILAGGETTVTLQGNGKGGRNQEMALAFALQAEQQGLSGNWAFLSGGTDGRDGPTDAAGGLVDCGTIERIQATELNPNKLLANNDSNTALNSSHDLLMTGASGTNVADLQILLLQNEI